MPEQIENRMVVDSEWDEIEYRVKHRNRYQRQKEAYEQAEREEIHGKYAGSR